MRNLQVNFENLDNNKELTVSLNGRLTSMNAMNFKRDLLAIIKEKKEDCYINISELQAMDVTGVNALAMAHREAVHQDTKMYIVSNQENPAMEFLHLTKFNQYFNFQRA